MDISMEQIDRFLEGSVSEQEREAFLQWLHAGSDNMRTFILRAEMHTDLRLSLVRRSLQENALADIQKSPIAKSNKLKLSPRMLFALAIATAVSIAFFLNWSGQFSTSSSKNTIARLTHQSEAVWVGTDFAEREFLAAGRLELESGIVRLDFTNGAIVTLEGPAVLEIVGKSKIRLLSGILTANIPESAVGFEVKTPMLEVVDLGTAFGVSVGERGATDVSVFEGEVAVSRGNGSEKPQSVLQGEAVRATRDAPSVESVLFDTRIYEKSWPINSGIVQTTGLMKFVAPNPGFIPGNYEDNKHIVVFAERQNVLLKKRLAVDMTRPGEFKRDWPKQFLEAGSTVRSYLLQLDPEGSKTFDSKSKPRVFGQITFASPIVALIATGPKMKGSDDIVGNPIVDYGLFARGIETTPQGDATAEGKDSVVWTADKRTLILNLAEGSAVDQIRVLVSQPPSHND